MKHLIVCADGTWGSPESSAPSNVLLLARSVAARASDAEGGAGMTEQVVYYDWGVGSESLSPSAAISGSGIDKNIQDCYRFLVHNYAMGDRLYFFGFSRGAYTVRSLAGLIRNAGLLRSTEAQRIPEAYALYRRRGAASSPDSYAAVDFRRHYAHADRLPIDFIGVWDTVGSLGIPVPFWGSLAARDFLFHDTALSSTVLCARHALALDERRDDFTPTLWTDNGSTDLKQSWFAGGHGDIGGGNRDPRLAEIALAWLAAEAVAGGLVFDPASVVATLLERRIPAAPGKLTNAARGLFALRPRSTRAISGSVHRSARARWDADSDGYRRKAYALNALLDSVDRDWRRIAIEG